MKSEALKAALAALAVAMLVMAATTANAVTLVNESFESPVASADGEKITAPIGPAGFYRLGSDRVFLHSEVFGSVTTPYGDQVLGTFLNSSMSTASNAHGIVTTTITDVLQPATEYTLTFNAGNARAGETTPTSNLGATAQLLAGSSVLDMVTVVTNTNDMSQSGSIVFTTGLDHPNLGETLGIRFFQTSGD